MRPVSAVIINANLHLVIGDYRPKDSLVARGSRHARQCSAADVAFDVAEEDVARAVPIAVDRKAAPTALEAFGRVVAEGLLYPEAYGACDGRLWFCHFVHPRAQLLCFVFEALVGIESATIG
jgi:hypothetical protein